MAVPVTDGGGNHGYLDLVPLASDGTWGGGVFHLYSNAYDQTSSYPGNIVVDQGLWLR